MLFIFVLGTLAQQITLLSTERPKINFFPYTAQQKVQVAQSAANLMSIYVHREEKINFYKAQNPNIDPLPRIQNIAKNAARMSDKDLHYGIASIFQSQRDYHTVYRMPGPHGCYEFETAVGFQMVDSPNPLDPTVVVSGKNPNQRVLQQSPDASKVNIGDRLVSVNGQSFVAFAKANAFNFGGANDFGAMRAALKALSMRSGKTLPVPDTNQQRFTLRNQQGGTYNVNMPWFAIKNVNCARASSFVSPTQFASNDRNVSLESFQNDMGMNMLESNFTYSFAARNPVINFRGTSDPIVQWGIYDPQNTRLGVIKVASFEPQNGNIDRITSLIAGLLTNQLRGTNGMVFDMRNNPGGQITMADKLPLLFNPNVPPVQYRAINNNINRQLFSTGVAGPNWARSLNGQTGKYSKVTMLAGKVTNNFGRVPYNKPIGLFINSNCYSSCDLFSAYMKDNKLARIYGEDGTTGAGGANVVQYNSYLARAASMRGQSLLPLLPFANGIGSQDMTVAWRQMLRPGNKQLIEDNGVKADLIVRPSLQDIKNGNSASQWDRIAKDLLGQRNRGPF